MNNLVFKPAFDDFKTKINYRVTLGGRYIPQKFLAVFHQKKKGIIELYLLPAENGGLSTRLMYVGEDVAFDYKGYEYDCELNKEQIVTLLKNFCDKTFEECEDDESYFSFISVE